MTQITYTRGNFNNPFNDHIIFVIMLFILIFVLYLIK